MNAQSHKFHIFPSAVVRRRKENGGLAHLSDWQVHSAHVTAGDITTLASGFQTGPIYVPMPTGSGKTTGAVWGIVDALERNPQLSIAFLTPYQDAVDQVYGQLSAKLGVSVVGHYHTNSGANKEEELSKQVVVLTHQFVSSNPGRLDDRDQFIVDEAIYDTGSVTLALSDMFLARDWATTNNVMPDEFTHLADFAVQNDKRMRDSDWKFVALQLDDQCSWAKRIGTDLNLRDYAQSIDDMEVMSSIQRFCEALALGLAFLSRGGKDKQRYQPRFSAALFGVPNLERTVVLTATGGLIYDLAGPFKQSTASRDYWTAPTFEDLNLVQLFGPEINAQYRQWGKQEIKDQAVAYVDWLIAKVPEQSLYLTVPKQVLDRCLRGFLGLQSKGEVDLPAIVQMHGKTVYVSSHGRSVGSNEFKDCEAVLYLWDDYKPASVAIQRYHTLANEPITQEALDIANHKKMSGKYEKIREGMLVDNMMQQIGRGRVRQYDEFARCGKMQAYILTAKPSRFETVAIHYAGCTTSQLVYGDAEVSDPRCRVTRVLNYLRVYGSGRDVGIKEIENKLRFSIRKHYDELVGSWELTKLNYELVRGSRGRGKATLFRYSG